MTATAIVMAMAAIVLAGEVVLWIAGDVTAHGLPGGAILFSVFGALVLVRVAKGIAAAGVQQPGSATDADDE